MDAEEVGQAEDLSDLTDLAWFKETARKRALLGIPDRSEKPYTSRANVFLRGLPRQVRDPNFLHETLDCRIAEVLTRKNLPLDGPIPEDLVTDCRQSVFRQLADGRFVMMGNSLPFNHELDRVYVAHEVCRHFGWGADIKIEDLHIGHPHLVQFGMVDSLSKMNSAAGKKPEAKPASERKSKRLRRGDAAPQHRAHQGVQPYRTKTNDIMGNSMDLADAATILYPVWLANDRLFKEPRLIFPPDKEWRRPRNCIHFECVFDDELSAEDLSNLISSHIRTEDTFEDEASDAGDDP